MVPDSGLPQAPIRCLRPLKGELRPIVAGPVPSLHSGIRTLFTHGEPPVNGTGAPQFLETA